MATRVRRAGFTLIEVLVVMAIILTLVALLAAGLNSAKKSAKQKATRALIGRIQSALENYFSDFRDYPPDGYDGTPLPPAAGVGVGYGVTPTRQMKGTALLMYYLCRPLVKLTYMGDPTDPSGIDIRNYTYTPVGPYLKLGPENFSRGRGDGGTDLFNPGFVWAGGPAATAFWDAPGNMRLCEIIDAYYRPLCYDKVKTAAVANFQPNRFHSPTGGSATAGYGYLAHPDQDFLMNEASYLDDEELICPTKDPNHECPNGAADRYKWSIDPRFKPGIAAPDGCCPNSLTSATASTHAPRNIGGYDLWSTGQSYTNPRDDITSWGE
jgi:prepilin-type N-terminal cleavage/methylation domain-containing protein